jgi:DNA-binding SARP family transcriptional activator
MTLQLNLLGGFDCRSGTGDVLTFPTSKVRALFAYLATNPDQGHRREKLADLLWGDETAGEGRANLRKALSRLRQSLPGDARDCLAVDRSQLAIRPGGLEVDVGLFLKLAADGTPETMERAAGLYRGAFLESFPDCGEAFEEWLLAERRRLDETLHEVLRRLLDHYVVTGAIDRAIQVALRLIALDPLQEGVHRTLIRLYMYQDRVGAALHQYRRCRDVLERELGVPPDPETERLRAELSKLLPDGAAGQDTLLREGDDLPERATVLRSAARERTRRRTELAGRPSIAVLCFATSDDAGSGHLGVGMAEDIATELGRFRELDVIAPRSALAYRDAAVPPDRVGTELGTAYVLEGTLRPAGRDLRITVRLVETDTARQLWAERYDCPMSDLFNIQDDVARRIVVMLVGRIEDARLEAARHARTDDLVAYDLWLRGWSALKRADLAAIGEARRCFQQAVAKDPQFARAYVGLAMAKRMGLLLLESLVLPAPGGVGSRPPGGRARRS